MDPIKDSGVKNRNRRRTRKKKNAETKEPVQQVDDDDDPQPKAHNSDDDIQPEQENARPKEPVHKNEPRNPESNTQVDYTGKLWTPEDFKIAFAALSEYK